LRIGVLWAQFGERWCYFERGLTGLGSENRSVHWCDFAVRSEPGAAAQCIGAAVGVIDIAWCLSCCPYKRLERWNFEHERVRQMQPQRSWRR
jgi:hypothetical protein